jgi:methionine-rich copper-binding protein CopC
MRSVARIGLLMSAFLFATVGTTLAHAVLVEVAPPLNGSVAGPEVVFHLRFNSRVDAARSVLNLVSADGKTRQITAATQSSANSLDAKSPDLKTGHYLLRWQVLAADGHITRGEIPFNVE